MPIEMNPWNNPIDSNDSLADEVEWLLAECDIETYIAFGLAYINEKLQQVLGVEGNPDTNDGEENGVIQELLAEAFKKSFLEIRAATELQQMLLKGEVTEENDTKFRQSGIDFKNSVLKARKAWDEIATKLIEETQKSIISLGV